MANRWVFTQFAFNVNNRGNPIAPYVQCFAVSTSGDPTGTYYRYAWTLSNTYFPDYPKLAVWPDAYYMTVNYFNGLNFVGSGAIAFDRSKMLNGQAATGIGFGPLGIAYGGLLPSDLDGSILPPSGTPNYFGAVDTSGTSSGSTFQIWKFHVDFTTPTNSTFGAANHTPNSNLAVGSYFFNLCGGFRNCIQQPASSQGLDAIADRLMNRLQYQRFADGHESLVANHTVGVGSSNNQAAVRWYEIRGLSATPVIYQQGTYSPSSDNRWMGSIAMDQAGNIALGYSVSSSTISPSIRYTGRVAGDPLGTLPQGEATLIAGSGSQTSNLNRWGDYSMMAVDPVDDCTFWYTQEYYAVTSTAGWQTRIGSFKFANCGVPICPTGWSCADLGNATPTGSQSLSSGTWTIQGGGADIWFTSDQFHFVWQSLASDGGISARVVSQSNSNVWAKAGVMLRQSSDPNSAFYDAMITPGNGIAVQYRPYSGASAIHLLTTNGVPPAYLQVGRVGSSFTAYTSSDGVTWTAIPGSTVTLSMSGALLQGLAVTSHNSAALSTVTLDNLSLSTTQPPPSPAGCSTGWSCADLGNATPTGSQSLSSGTWTIQGGGADIWFTSDQFHFVWQSLASDGGISARVVSQSNSNVWAKAGVMLRQSSDPNSAFYDAMITPGNGIAVQYRPSSGASAIHLLTTNGVPPAYLQVGRVGSSFTAYTSSDGVTWTAIPGSTTSLGLSGSLLQGLAVTSHNSAALSTVTVDTVSLSTTQPPPSPAGCSTGWSCADVGGATPAGGQSLSSGTWTIQGGGADIWFTSDQFHYVWQSLASDGGISARVVSQSNSNVWAKAGVMLRQSGDPSSAFYDVMITPGNGIAVQYRPSSGASAIHLLTTSGAPPAYLQVGRVGSSFTAYTSNDGVSWTAIPGSTVTLSMSGTLLQGLAVTSHNSAALSTVTVDTVKTN